MKISEQTSGMPLLSAAALRRLSHFRKDGKASYIYCERVRQGQDSLNLYVSLFSPRENHLIPASWPPLWSLGRQGN